VDGQFRERRSIKENGRKSPHIPLFARVGTPEVEERKYSVGGTRSH
jgi:hypothetical protein